MRIPVRIKRVVILCLVFLMLSSGTVSAKTAFSEDPEAIEEAAQSVLFLMTDAGSGSGFILSDGQTLVTNYHVIEGTRHLLCTDEFGECYLFTEVLIADKKKDIAILHAPEPTGLKAFMADTDRPLRGEKVVAIGSPKSFFKLNSSIRSLLAMSVTFIIPTTDTKSCLPPPSLPETVADPYLTMTERSSA